MGLLADWQIADLAAKGLITPFVDNQVRDGVISYGLSSYGYDVRVSREYKIFTNHMAVTIDPKNFSTSALVDYEGDFCLIPPNSFALARTMEYLVLPENILGIVLGKSTYARCGVVTNFTPLEPGWEGCITIEISNTAPLPAKIYSGEGIAQVLFFEGDAACRRSYASKAGKYNRQVGITLPKI